MGAGGQGYFVEHVLMRILGGAERRVFTHGRRGHGIVTRFVGKLRLGFGHGLAIDFETRRAAGA